MATPTTSFQLLEPVEYVREYLNKGFHPPGSRKLLDYRSTSLQTNLISSADGSALVRHGNTSVLVSIKGELSEPDYRQDFNEQGRVVLNIDGQPNFSENQVAYLNDAAAIIRNLFDANKIVNLKSLCIQKARICWTLFVDVNCLNCDGAVLETCLIAIVAAFYYATLPTITIKDASAGSKKAFDDNGEVREQQFPSPPNVGEIFAPFFDDVDSDWSSTPTPIDFENPQNNSGNVRVDFNERKSVKLAEVLPVASTFLLFDNANFVGRQDENSAQPVRTVLAVDPTEEEKNVFANNDFSLVCACSVVESINAEKNAATLCGVYKFGGAACLDEEIFNKCAFLAGRRCRHVLRLIDEAKPRNSNVANDAEENDMAMS